MYKPKTSSLANGEIIKDLLDICNEHFIDSFIKPYAGANSECIFCGAQEQRTGTDCNHAEYCPVVKYKNLTKKHKYAITIGEP